jgi:NarL family two-component system response regulator LiaR
MISSYLLSLDEGSATMLWHGQPIPDTTQETGENTEVVVLPAVSETQVSAQASVSPIRVLVVDDHEVVRRGICTSLAEERDFEVIGQAATGDHALRLTIQHQPDIILLDIWLGPLNALDLVQQLQRASAETRIVIFTGLMDDTHLFRAIRLGVHGYLQKSLPLSELITALRAVYRGERVISDPHAITQVLNEYNRISREQERLRAGLSDLEIELLRLVAEGRSNKEIAAHQFWSEVTVKRKMQDIYRKLQVTDRAQAVAEAMRMGLI